MTDHAVPEPLNAEEEAALRAEAESEKNDPDLRHATWQRLILRMFATLDARQSAITECTRNHVFDVVDRDAKAHVHDPALPPFQPCSDKCINGYQLRAGSTEASARVATLEAALRRLDDKVTNYLNAVEPKDYAITALIDARRAARSVLTSEEAPQ